MKALLVFAAFAISAAVTGCTVQTTDPTKVVFPDNASKALVVMQGEPASVAYTLQLARYNPATESLDATPFGGFVFLTVAPSQTPTYVAATLEPGTYVLQDLTQQTLWAVCFNASTLSFTVHPGDAVFLGDFRPRLHLAQLQLLARAHGDTVSRGEVFHYFDGIVPPQITRPVATGADFLTAKRYEATSMPMLHGRLQPVVAEPAKFGIGYALNGDRVCGGYFNKALKSAQ